MDLLLACQPHESSVALVAFAWGVARQTIHNIFNKMLQSTTADVSRKPRRDTGRTLKTSEDKRRSIYTPQFVFAKMFRAEHPDGKLTRSQIAAAWAEATEQKQQACRAKADEWIQQGPFLLTELTKALSVTRGSVSWQTVATLVWGSGNLEMISENTIRQFVMSLHDSSYTSTKILPKLSKSHKVRRKLWGLQFWAFWESATRFNNTQIILVHMDEKWFWLIVVRRKQKNVPMLGIEPVQHKSHLEKMMGIASSAFVPHNNNMQGGGNAHLVSLTRVGQMMRAARDTYKRVYWADGTYHYPKIPTNRLRVKRNLYFHNMEITGSSKGTTSDPKFDFLSWFAETEIPVLEQLCQKVGITSGGKQCEVRYQMDGAGPHQDATLNQFVEDKFLQ